MIESGQLEGEQRARPATVPPSEPKPATSVTIPREVKTEIENLRRLVQTVQDRLHALTRA